MMMTVMMATTIMMTLKFSIPPWPICRAQAVAKYLHDLDHGYDEHGEDTDNDDGEIENRMNAVSFISRASHVLDVLVNFRKLLSPPKETMTCFTEFSKSMEFCIEQKTHLPQGMMHKTYARGRQPNLLSQCTGLIKPLCVQYAKLPII